MKIFIISLLFSSLSYAAHDRDSGCYELRRNADSRCLSYDVECRNLGACAHRRNTCPETVKTQSGCEGINECMSDTEGLLKSRPKDIRSGKVKNACIYHWTTYGSGNCRLYNTSAEFITFPTCPGRRIVGKNNDDVNFDCEGHRALIKKTIGECNDARKVYVNKCTKVKGFKKITTGTKTCRFEDVKIFPADSAHKGAIGVNDSERGKHKAMPHVDGGNGGKDDGGLGTGK
jgi:hypothetical protein